ncbi:MAG: riboflavin synthase subunit alpha [Candidatus Kerfeldbacteria bacterium RIFCSPHIGHO2_02_FULL_42_14]|uniref:Riboflavin synthase n=1 Tax=Candidatus Kerfeldbacteria bacterium RIFCSPHIGHO2_02_FULL_42_14 TaxID=1798540 RepID=A0A1G2AR76_9BACT|nr:MAG: riboflavin synthase subunit alpha [Candidatus Kerfeldbacteria bacterium RIFCSPHIGHO2_02_FULL_42_14]OGY80682.1 MAG: riboflavin synthase subunit alpha [Candidatus Kerfeldbacteria bacterium RIFCSPHIGHO2_12_FULL_42_13]OGY82609.1 MAG: riboflavin synthase subunit alpha [Candidatus Kerfeldbacteria bacterium RIFCSPLOWO2_02_FULL_42_19]OGY85212.1 MAG: riboflavin synthase subunit alpha [Candidatus Kerfeldbacteria bacterium RIFCSPLOWO2_12_FULL_43_9]
MFTGIIQGTGTIVSIKKFSDHKNFTVQMPQAFSAVKKGASIAIDGVCLTIVTCKKKKVTFDFMAETEKKTTLGHIKIHQRVNIERSMTLKDEIGGHLLSGHVDTQASIDSITTSYNNYRIQFKIKKSWMKYIFPKGFIALDGVSLTIVDTWNSQGYFSVAFIPETLKRTTFGWKREGHMVNVEIDRQTQAIVHTVESFLKRKIKAK